MKIRQIRNATLVVEFGPKKFLIDPWLAPKGSLPGFEGTLNDHLRNPTAELVVPIDEIVDADAVILTHNHPDHWDEVAAESIRKDIPFFVQHALDREAVQSAGFSDVRVLTGNPEFEGVKITKTPGQHGPDDVMQAAYDLLGEVCGLIFQHPDEQTLYVAGDTVYNQYVEGVLSVFQPAVVVMNCCAATIPGFDPIIMGKKDVKQVYDSAPGATLIASHMEAVNHAALDRAELRAFIQQENMGDRVVVPEDGEVCEISPALAHPKVAEI